MKRILLSAALLLATTGAAAAHTSYLQPDDFWANDGNVTLNAAYATTFFSPQIALAPDFVMVMPDGSNGILSRIEITAQSTLLTSTLPLYGTYRFTSGEKLGGVASMIAIDGQWRQLGQGEIPPEGATTTTLQTVTVADVYVSRGAPTRTAVDQTIGRLALRPITHPNQILVSSGFQVQAVFDGAPFANAALVLYRDGEPETNLSRYFTTDANGAATITFDGPGQYILAARHRANAAPGSAAAVQSFTTTLVFEALTELPPVIEIPAPPEEGRRRSRRGAIAR